MGYAAQGDCRFELFRPDADLVIMCDADTVIMRSFAWLAICLKWKQALAGVLAHYHFPWEHSDGDFAKDWSIISKSVLGKEIPTPYRYTLDTAKPTPFYINYGAFIGPPKLMSQFYCRYREIQPQVDKVLGNEFSEQVSLALAVYDLGLPTVVLPMRFNFPNDRIADTMYPREMASVIIMHYLRTGAFDRQKIFSSEAEMQKFLGLDLVGSDRIFQNS